MTLTIALMASSFASSHREAPAISKDPSADLTDFYAFVNPTDSTKVDFILNVNPLEDPGGGPNFHSFDDNVTYSVKCDNEGDALEDIEFRFKFQTTYAFPGDFLYNSPLYGGSGDIADPASLNINQTMTVTRFNDGVPTVLVGAGNPVDVAPINVGVVSAAAGEYDPKSAAGGTLTASYIDTRGTVKYFAGPRQEGFFVDLERTFDLLNLGAGGNLNTLLGKNVHSIAIQVPAQSLTKDGLAPTVAGQNNVIACWATTSRLRTRVLNTDGTQSNSGALRQISRLGMPLVNEAVIGIGDKDKFNAAAPAGDAQFLSYVTNPLLPAYVQAVLGVENPMDGADHTPGTADDGYDDPAVPNAVVPQPARDDLVLTFLTGLPGLNLPGGFSLGGNIPGEPGPDGIPGNADDKKFGAFEALRINLATASGFPNGRLVGEDITDTTLMVAQGLLIPAYAATGALVSDGVGSTGLTYLTNFPFLGDPWPGDDHPAGFHDLP